MQSSVPVDSRASAMLPQDTVPAVEEPVGEGLRYPEKVWQQELSLAPEQPQFTNQAAFVEGVPASTAPDQCDTLAEYEFSIQYQPGLSHWNAVALSRCLCNRRSGLLICRQCGPLLDPIAEETIMEEPDEEKTLVKRVDTDSE